MKHRPQTTVVLAMTVDGKITDRSGTAARFGSTADKSHLESQIALVDAVLFGAGTLRAYGTSLSITNPQLLQLRREKDRSPQPIHLVASASGVISDRLKFFTQPLPRWLLTTTQGVKAWEATTYFDRLLIGETRLENPAEFEWKQILDRLYNLGIEQLAVLGGGSLIASLFEVNAIDEIWLTVCPVILGGTNSITPVEGNGWLQSQGKNLRLLEVKQIDDEVFLHYSVN